MSDFEFILRVQGKAGVKKAGRSFDSLAFSDVTMSGRTGSITLLQNAVLPVDQVELCGQMYFSNPPTD
jgi:hypothetical protein